MGTSKPVPKTPTVVYAPPPPPSPPAPAGPAGPSAEEKQQEREQNLLRRARSKIGTILSGFRGILIPSNNTGQRKSLLGE